MRLELKVHELTKIVIRDFVFNALNYAKLSVSNDVEILAIHKGRERLTIEEVLDNLSDGDYYECDIIVEAYNRTLMPVTLYSECGFVSLRLNFNQNNLKVPHIDIAGWISYISAKELNIEKLISKI